MSEFVPIGKKFIEFVKKWINFFLKNNGKIHVKRITTNDFCKEFDDFLPDLIVGCDRERYI